MKIITATIEMRGANAGQVTIETSGYQGVGCLAVEEAFTKGLDCVEHQRSGPLPAVRVCVPHSTK
jgi:hypothetical protein